MTQEYEEKEETKSKCYVLCLYKPRVQFGARKAFLVGSAHLLPSGFHSSGRGNGGGFGSETRGRTVEKKRIHSLFILGGQFARVGALLELAFAEACFCSPGCVGC